MSAIVEKFIKALNGQKLGTPYYNWSPFILGNGLNTRKHFRKYYSDFVDYNLLFLAKQGQCVAFVSGMSIPSAARDFFRRYWKNPEELEKRIVEMDRFVKKVDSIYNKMSHRYVIGEPISKLLEMMEKIVNFAWTANAIAFFSLHFDKDFCLKLLREVRASIKKEQLDSFWDEAIVPVSDSLENRHKIMVLKLLKKKASWQKISELCQFFKATYYDVAILEEAERLFREEYGDFTGKENAELIILEKEQNERKKKYKKFLSGLSKEEKKLVSYIQRIIELRDQRKDFTAKASTIMFRVARRMFEEVGLPDSLRLYITFGEFLKGIPYLMKNKKSFEKRRDGFAMFVHYRGEVEFEYVDFGKNKQMLESLYIKQQQVEVGSDEIRGQTGSPGIARGVAKIVRDISEAEKFLLGDILVTGMTRAEFVPLMKKAAAIVTNEGGITCHAAIVARELQKPCVIGTKIATMSLKDGDLVEVNANEGAVRIIKDL